MRFGCRWQSADVSRPRDCGFAGARRLATGVAQQKPAEPNDPRVGLKPGLRDAGVAARNMELVSSCRGPRGSSIRRTRPAWRCRASVRRTPRRLRRAPTAPQTGGGAPQPAGRRSRTRRVRRRRRARAGWTSPTPISRSAARTWSWATSTASTPTTSRTRESPRLLASIVCPGGQGDVSVYGNLLFMSVEQTRGRIDCGTQGVADAGEQGALPRRAHLRHHRHHASRSRWRRCRPAAARTRTRWCRSKDKADTLRLRLGHRRRALGRGARRLLGRRSEGGPEHGALQHRRDQGAARRAREGARSSIARASSPTRRPAPSPACGRAAITAPARSAPARPTSATTSRCSRRSAWPRARARATAS